MLTVICTSNKTYLPFFNSFTNSIKRNTDYNLITRLVNVDEVVGDINDSKEFKTAHEEMCYCSHIRFKTILDNLDKDLILYSDVDMIVRDDLDELESVISTHDISFCQTHPPESLDELVINNYGHEYICYEPGLIGIRSNDKTKQLFETLASKISKNMLDYDIDEYLIFEELVDSDLSIGSIPRKFKDPCLKDESSIWSGHSNVKNSRKFRNEMLLYSNHAPAV